MKLGDTHINLIKYDHEKDLRVTFDKSIYLDVHPMPLAKSIICLDWFRSFSYDHSTYQVLMLYKASIDNTSFGIWSSFFYFSYTK